MDRGAWQATVHGVTKSQTQVSATQNMCEISDTYWQGGPVDQGIHPPAITRLPILSKLHQTRVFFKNVFINEDRKLILVFIVDYLRKLSILPYAHWPIVGLFKKNFIHNFFKHFYLFFIIWLYLIIFGCDLFCFWFVSAHGLFLAVAGRGYSSLWYMGLPLQWLLLSQHRL